MASKGDALVAGNISQVPSYLMGLGKEAVQKEFKKQTDIFVKNDVDFLIGEVNMFYFYVTSLLSIHLYGNSPASCMPVKRSRLSEIKRNLNHGASGLKCFSPPGSANFKTIHDLLSCVS